MKITTNQNIEVLKAFQQIAIKKYTKKIYISLITMAILGVVFLALNSFWLGLILLVFAITFLIVFPTSLKKSLNKETDSNKTLNENIVVEYEFLDEYYLVANYKNGEEIGRGKNEYSNIFKIDETNDYLFMYISSSVAYPIIKKDLNESDLNNLTELLKSKCNKYNIIK